MIWTGSISWPMSLTESRGSEPAPRMPNRRSATNSWSTSSTLRSMVRIYRRYATGSGVACMASAARRHAPHHGQWWPRSHGRRRLTSVRIHLYEGPLALVPPKHLGASDVVCLGVDDNMIDRIQRFGSVIRFTPQGRADIFSREVRPYIDVGMVNDLHGSWGLD